jgi:hypothetical protein
VPVISGGGAGGNTTAQVVASGKVLPVADATGVTVDTTTYSDFIRGGGAKLTTLVLPSDGGTLAIALAGDAFPRWVLGGDPTNYGLLFGDGTAALTSAAAVISYFNGALSLYSTSLNEQFNIGVADTNHGSVNRSRGPISLSGGAAALLAGTGAPTLGGNVGDLYVRTDGANGTLILYRCTVAGTAGNATWVPVLTPVSPVGIVTSGALTTVQLVTATGAQLLTTRDAETITPCTFNPGAATTATVTVALSPDNVTYSTLGIETEPAGVAFDGTIHLVKVRVPAGWYLKLTVNAQATLGLTTYY